MNTRLRFLILLLLIHYIGSSQTSTISGKILDTNDKSPLVGVNILFGNNQGTTSNIDGDYNISLKPGKHNIVFQYLGYETYSLEINIAPNEKINQNIYLSNTSKELDLVVVSAGKFEQKLEEVTVSMDVIKPTLIENKNTTDLEILMNQSPGVQVVDGQANIRGGSGWSYNTGSRVLVMIDDMPILSGDRGTVQWNMIPMENISQIEVIKGASSVLFGSSAMNGVINVRTSYPKGAPETKISLFSGQYDKPRREGLHWWGNNIRRFHGMSFNYAEKKTNTGIVVGGNVYANDGFKGGFVTDSTHHRYGEEIPVSEKRGRFNFNINHNAQNISGLSYGINGNLVFSDTYESLIFQHDSVGYTPIGVTDGDKPVRFNQMMFNIDPFIKYINSNNNTQHSYKSRFFRDDYQPHNNEIGYSNVFFQEYQFQKTFNLENEAKIVSTTGLSSNYIKGNYDEIYGELGTSRIKQLFNYSGYSQIDAKYQRINLSIGVRLEHLIFQNDHQLVPVIRSGLNYQLFDGTFVRSSFGQGYRYPTIMELFVKTDFDPVYVYPNPDLQPESGWSSEIGLKQLLQIGEWKGMLDIAGFIMYYDDMIEFTFGGWGPMGVDSNNDGSVTADEFDDNLYGFGFKCINIGETRITGFEISAMGEGKIGNVDVSLLASYTKVNPVIVNPEEDYYEYVGGLQDGNTINYVESSYYTEENILKYRHENILKFDINLDYGMFMTGLSTRYNSMMKNMDLVFGSSAFNEGGIDVGIDEIINLGVLDSRERMLEGDLILDYRFGIHLNEDVTLSLIIDNLLNREYQTRPADLGPPRAYTLKISAKI
ncbi:MAG: hypothetical protein CMD27_02730 [Flavobacteriales bacterium]|nr:hypothetical protein [Flavobacteriales bacterium]